MRAMAPYALLQVKGPDAVEFVHRLCTQDVRPMHPGSVAPLAFLDGKGKLVATGLALRDEQGIWIETDACQADGLYEMLDRYHFTEKLELSRFDGACAEWCGPDAPQIGWNRVDGAVEVRVCAGGLGWRRWHGAAPSADGAPLSEADAALLRVLVGRVHVGVDTEKTTLGPEANLDDAIVVSESKGCYTGQEIVARIQTYGHINRRLCLVLVEGAATPFALDTTLFELEEGAPVGRLKTSVPCEGGIAALAFLPRELWDAGTRLHVGAADGPVAVVEPFAGTR